MIELKQFLLWILRKICRWPVRWYNHLLELYEYSNWYIPIIGYIAITFGSGILFGILALVTISNYVANIVLLSIWGIGLGFIISAGVHTMYRAFKQEQQDLIDRLKHNGS